MYTTEFKRRVTAFPLRNLQNICHVQFSVIRQYEADTWYDQHGRIVFTNSKGLPGVGHSRAEWNAIKDTLLPGQTTQRTPPHRPNHPTHPSPPAQ